jgi:hypothetical protein
LYILVQRCFYLSETCISAVTRYWLIGRIRDSHCTEFANFAIASKQANPAVIYSSDVMMPEASVKIESGLTKIVDLGVADRSF